MGLFLLIFLSFCCAKGGVIDATYMIIFLFAVLNLCVYIVYNIRIYGMWKVYLFEYKIRLHECIRAPFST